MKKNKVNIDGNKNTVFQDIGNSQNNTDKRKNTLGVQRMVGLIAGIATILGLVITVVLNWNEIIDFFE